MHKSLEQPATLNDSTTWHQINLDDQSVDTRCNLPNIIPHPQPTLYATAPSRRKLSSFTACSVRAHIIILNWLSFREQFVNLLSKNLALVQRTFDFEPWNKTRINDLGQVLLVLRVRAKARIACTKTHCSNCQFSCGDHGVINDLAIFDRWDDVQDLPPCLHCLWSPNQW